MNNRYDVISPPGGWFHLHVNWSKNNLSV